MRAAAVIKSTTLLAFIIWNVGATQIKNGKVGGEIVFPNLDHSGSRSNSNRQNKGLSNSHNGVPLDILRSLGGGEQDFAQALQKLLVNGMIFNNPYRFRSLGFVFTFFKLFFNFF